MVYTFDSNTIELYLKLCLWTMLHHDRGTIKIYILMDIKGSISTSTHLTERAVHDSPIMDKIPIVRVNSLCLHFHLNNVFFVTRVKENILYEVIDNREVEQSARLFSNETIKLTGALTSQKYTDFRLTVYEDFSTNTVIISPPITLSLMH